MTATVFQQTPIFAMKTLHHQQLQQQQQRTADESDVYTDESVVSADESVGSADEAVVSADKSDSKDNHNSTLSSLASLAAEQLSKQNTKRTVTPDLKYTKKEDEVIKEILDELTFNGYERNGAAKKRKQRLRNFEDDDKEKLCRTIAARAGTNWVRRWTSVIKHYNGKLATKVADLPVVNKNAAKKSRKRTRSEDSTESITKKSKTVHKCACCKTKCGSEHRIVIGGIEKHLCVEHAIRMMQSLLN